MEEATPHNQLQAPAKVETIIPTPFEPSPSADPHARLAPLRQKSSNHVFYNYTAPTSPIPIPNRHEQTSNGQKYLLPEPAVSKAYREHLDEQQSQK